MVAINAVHRFVTVKSQPMCGPDLLGFRLAVLGVATLALAGGVYFWAAPALVPAAGWARGPSLGASAPPPLLPLLLAGNFSSDNTTTTMPASRRPARWPKTTPSADAELAPPCPPRKFRLRPGDKCEPMLNCAAIATSVTMGPLFNQGGVKKLYKYARRVAQRGVVAFFVLTPVL